MRVVSCSRRLLIVSSSSSFVEALLWVSPWGVCDGQEGGVPPPVFCYSFAVVDLDRNSNSNQQGHDTKRTKYGPLRW
jgi:hypothetical protein